MGSVLRGGGFNQVRQTLCVGFDLKESQVEIEVQSSQGMPGMRWDLPKVLHQSSKILFLLFR